MTRKMKQIWHSRETELSSKKASDLVFKTHQGTYFVDTTTPPLKANYYYEEISAWCHAKDLVKQTNLLQEKLRIVARALEEITDLAGNNENGINDYSIVCCAQDALKEIGLVGTSVKEAEECN